MNHSLQSIAESLTNPPASDNHRIPARIQARERLCLLRRSRANVTTAATLKTRRVLVFALGNVQIRKSCSDDLVPMTGRNRILITAVVLCHLLVALPVVTSQLPPTNPAAAPQRKTGGGNKTES